MQADGYVYWNELMTADVEASKAFYGATLGWTFSSMPTAEGTYWLFMPDGADQPAGGMMEWPGAPEAPTNVWFTYIAVLDLDRALAVAVTGGGSVVRPPFEVPGIGRIAIVRDSTGALIGWMTPATPI